MKELVGSYEVIGNDVPVTMAVEAGQLRLNAFERTIVHSRHKSISHLEAACPQLQNFSVPNVWPTSANWPRQPTLRSPC